MTVTPFLLHQTNPVALSLLAKLQAQQASLVPVPTFEPWVKQTVDGAMAVSRTADGSFTSPMSALASCFPDDPPKESPHSPAKGTIRHTSTAKRLAHTVKYHREAVRALNKELEPVFKYRGKPAGESAPASLIVDLVAHTSTNILDSRVQLSKGIGAKDYGHPELYDKDPKVRYMFLISQLFDHSARELRALNDLRDADALRTASIKKHTKDYTKQPTERVSKQVKAILNSRHPLPEDAEV